MHILSADTRRFLVAFGRLRTASATDNFAKQYAILLGKQQQGSISPAEVKRMDAIKAFLLANNADVPTEPILTVDVAPEVKKKVVKEKEEASTGRKKKKKEEAPEVESLNDKEIKAIEQNSSKLESIDKVNANFVGQSIIALLNFSFPGVSLSKSATQIGRECIALVSRVLKSSDDAARDIIQDKIVYLLKRFRENGWSFTENPEMPSAKSPDVALNVFKKFLMNAARDSLRKNKQKVNDLVGELAYLKGKKGTPEWKPSDQERVEYIEKKLSDSNKTDEEGRPITFENIEPSRSPITMRRVEPMSIFERRDEGGDVLEPGESRIPSAEVDEDFLKTLESDTFASKRVQEAFKSALPKIDKNIADLGLAYKLLWEQIFEDDKGDVATRIDRNMKKNQDFLDLMMVKAGEKFGYNFSNIDEFKNFIKLYSNDPSTVAQGQTPLVMANWNDPDGIELSMAAQAVVDRPGRLGDMRKKLQKAIESAFTDQEIDLLKDIYQADVSQQSKTRVKEEEKADSFTTEFQKNKRSLNRIKNSEPFKQFMEAVEILFEALGEDRGVDSSKADRLSKVLAKVIDGTASREDLTSLSAYVKDPEIQSKFPELLPVLTREFPKDIYTYFQLPAKHKKQLKANRYLYIQKFRDLTPAEKLEFEKVKDETGKALSPVGKAWGDLTPAQRSYYENLAKQDPDDWNIDDIKASYLSDAELAEILPQELIDAAMLVKLFESNYLQTAASGDVLDEYFDVLSDKLVRAPFSLTRDVVRSIKPWPEPISKEQLKALNTRAFKAVKDQSTAQYNPQTADAYDDIRALSRLQRDGFLTLKPRGYSDEELSELEALQEALEDYWDEQIALLMKSDGLSRAEIAKIPPLPTSLTQEQKLGLAKAVGFEIVDGKFKRVAAYVRSTATCRPWFNIYKIALRLM